ncbi:MAG: terminase family protein, partial [Candidatus Paceibacterota bacterium]
MNLERTIPFAPLAKKHSEYIRGGLDAKISVAEGAIRSGKTLNHCIIAAARLEICRDKIHLASGSTMANAKLNIGVCNGFGLESLFRGRCRWGKFRDNEALYIQTQTGEKIVIFAGGGKADSYKRILGNSYGIWIATEINEHYDCPDSRTSFIKVAMGRQAAALDPLILWDLNPCNPNHSIYADYIDLYREQKLPGYQYQHFTLEDNLSITEERRDEIKAQYNPESVWYRRDILGQRVIAEGLIFRQFADNLDKWIVKK